MDKAPVCVSNSERFEKLGEISFFGSGQLEIKEVVVVLDDVAQRDEPAVVVETSFRVCPESLLGRRAVGPLGRAIGLEVIDADLISAVHIPPRLGV